MPREERRLTGVENRLLRRIFGPRVTEDWKTQLGAS
jgi:hypothetical protein